jgi:hypothetical protein
MMLGCGIAFYYYSDHLFKGNGYVVFVYDSIALASETKAPVIQGI